MTRLISLAWRLATAACLLAAFAGCSQQPKGPQLDPAGLPRAVHSLEKTVRNILDSCAVGDASGAHRPLHSVGKQISSVELLMGVADISDENQQAAEKTLKELEEGLAGIDNMMHESEEPEFDEQKIAKLRETLDSLRDHLPESVVAELREFDEVAAERMAKSEEQKAAEESDADAEATEPEAPAAEDEADDQAAPSEEPAADSSDEGVADEGPALSP